MSDALREVIVRPGDTLSGIALRELRDAGAWPLLFRINQVAISAAQAMPARRCMRGADWIFPGTRLLVPQPHKVPIEAALAETTRRWHSASPASD